MRVGWAWLLVMAACRFKDETPAVVDTEVHTAVDTDVVEDTDVIEDTDVVGETDVEETDEPVVPDSDPPEGPIEDCTNGTDDDGDALPDCEDADCFGLRVCDELICDDALDDDNDGLIDCADDDCWGELPCRVVREPVTASAHVRHHFSGVGAACAPVVPPASFTGFISATGYAYTTVTIPDFQTRVRDQVTGETCTWTASQLVGHWRGSDEGVDPWPPVPHGLMANSGCSQPSSWVVPPYVRPHGGVRWTAPTLVLNSVEGPYASSYSSFRPWLTLDLVQTYQMMQRVPGQTYSAGASACRLFDLQNTTSWSGTVVP